MRGPSLVKSTGDDNSATSTVAVIRMSPKEYVWPSHIYIAEYGSTAGGVVNPARGQLNRENAYFLVCSRWRLRVWSRETRSAAPSRVSLLILHTQAESGAYLRDSSRFTWRRSMCLLLLFDWILT